MSVEKLAKTISEAIEEICNQIVILKDHAKSTYELMTDLRVRQRKIEESMERMKSDFQLQVNFQSFQIIELQKRNEAIWETVMKPTQI